MKVFLKENESPKCYNRQRTSIESLLVGGGRAKLNAEVMMGIELLIPSYPEQCKISEFILTSITLSPFISVSLTCYTACYNNFAKN